MKRPEVGVAVIIKKNNLILLGKRIHKHSPNAWCIPAGHVEFFETAKESAKREIFEETGLGLDVNNLKFVTYTDDLYYHTKTHGITLVFKASKFSGDVILKEPDRCEEWKWFPTDKLPSPLVQLMKQLSLS